MGLSSCQLTIEGCARWREVAMVVMEYVDMLRRAQPQQWVFEEYAGIAAAQFKWRVTGRV